MKTVHIFAYVMALVFIVGETTRRGLDYFSINATTMVEDYLCGALLRCIDRRKFMEPTTAGGRATRRGLRSARIC